MSYTLEEYKEAGLSDNEIQLLHTPMGQLKEAIFMAAQARDKVDLYFDQKYKENK